VVPPCPKQEEAGLDEVDDLEAELQRRLEERRQLWQREWARD